MRALSFLTSGSTQVTADPTKNTLVIHWLYNRICGLHFASLFTIEVLRAHVENRMGGLRARISFGLFTMIAVELTANPTRRPLFAMAGLETLHRPSHYQEETQFYQDYFAPFDQRIVTDYSDRWQYHETQIHYASTSWRFEHISPGSMNGPYEASVREEFARQVLRQRIDVAIRKYFEAPERARDLKRARKALDETKNYKVSLSSAPPGTKQQRAEIRVGYDVFTDVSKFEYLQGPMQVGFYYQRFLNTVMGAPSSRAPLSMRLGADFGPNFPQASLNYRLNGDSFETSFTKNLARNVDGQLLSAQPLRTRPNLYPTYEARVIFWF